MANHSVWAIAANGGRAKIVRNLGSESEQKIEQFNMEQCKAAELMNDRAGRVFSSVGKSRSGMERHSDPVRNNERLFAEEISDYLLKKFTNKEFSSLVVTGAPRTLGDLRLAFPERLAGCIILEIGKDFTQLSDMELPVKLQALVKENRYPV